MIAYITTDTLKQAAGAEGLILQGCGGDPQEWLDGINQALTEEGILLNGAAFTDISVFEHGGLTNILFQMDDVKLDIGKLAMWRLQTHGTFGGTWLSDYLPNHLGISEDEPVPAVIEAPKAAKAPKAEAAMRVYIENAHDEKLGGFTMPLPTTRDALKPFLDAIEIADARDLSILEIRSPVKHLSDAVYSCADEGLSLNELNYLAAKLQGMDGEQSALFDAVLDAERHTGNVAEIINIVENIGHFDLQPAFDAEQYGEFLIYTEKDNTASAFDKLEV